MKRNAPLYISILIMLNCMTHTTMAADVTALRVLLVPNEEAILSSQMDGQISSYKVDQGDSFKKGDVLLRFDCRERQAKLNSVIADLTVAEETYQAQLKLKKMDAVSDLDVAIDKAVNCPARW